MAIARKPKKATKVAETSVNEKTIDALISKGGSSTKVQKPEQSDDDNLKGILIRLYQSHISDIAGILENLPKRQRLSRHAYIVQAIEEKIQRDKSKRK
ncbi:MAG: hypothetical protein ACK4S0_00145 [Sediminibacterium sp.]